MYYQPGRPDAAFLVESDGTITKGLDAFVPLLPGLRGGWLLLALWRMPILRPIAYMLYRVIARYRYRWFGKSDVCRVPTPELRARVLAPP